MNDTKQVDLDSLVGEHELDAVDTYVERVKDYGDNFEDAEAIRFRLDGVVYTAIEDPSDGYRSCLGQLFVSPADEVRNIFPKTRVLVRKKSGDPYQSNDTIEFIEIATGQTIMEVGTDDFDGYYPWFVSSFWPERLSVNAQIGR